jgi:trans-aconitate methyltransferase
MDARTERTRTRWNAIWARRAPEAMSWFEETPGRSLELVTGVAAPARSVIDVGGGASSLVDHLLRLGYVDLTVLDVSSRSIATTRRRLGPQSDQIAWIERDVTDWTPPRRWDVWHDRAVCHFLVDDADVTRYVAAATAAVEPGGYAIVTGFAPTGPDRCSDLPVRRWEAAALATEFAAFTPQETSEHVHRTPSGRTQDFTTLVLRRGDLETTTSETR